MSTSTGAPPRSPVAGSEQGPAPQARRAKRLTCAGGGGVLHALGSRPSPGVAFSSGVSAAASGWP
eukprot:9359516-Pyramimonas_sp.AAC.1